MDETTNPMEIKTDATEAPAESPPVDTATGSKEEVSARVMEGTVRQVTADDSPDTKVPIEAAMEFATEVIEDTSGQVETGGGVGGL